MAINRRNLDLVELLHYGELGQIPGLHPEVAKQISDMGGRDAIIERDDEDARETRLVIEVVDELVQREEIRPQLADELRQRYGDPE